MSVGRNKKGQARPDVGVSYRDVCKLALRLPGVAEGTSYGTAALKVDGSLMIRLKEDGATIVLRTTTEDRARLLTAAPHALYVTDHYVKHPWVLVRLAEIDPEFLGELIEEAWRLAAPAKPTKRRPSRA